jgi:prevent-host-death family protein
MRTGKEMAAGEPRTIKASEFKAKCLQLMDQVADSGDEIVITKNGLPISRLVPYRPKPQSLFGIDRGRIEILGDIIEPLDARWEADTGKAAWDGGT